MMSMSASLCLSASVSTERAPVPPSPHFCACYLWPWLGSPLATFRTSDTLCTSGLWMTSYLQTCQGPEMKMRECKDRS